MFLMDLVVEERKKDNYMAEYRGPDCPKCKEKSYQIEFGRTAYWYCRNCKEEVKDGWSWKTAVHSMEPCKECQGTAAHNYWCSVTINERKKKRK